MSTQNQLLKELENINSSIKLVNNNYIILFDYIMSDKELTDGAKIFYSLICNLANNDNNYICYGSLKYFSYKLKVCEKSIKNYIRELSEIGYIKRLSKKYFDNGLYSTKLRLQVNTDINVFIKRFEYLKNKYPEFYINDDDVIENIKEKNFSNNEKSFPNKYKDFSNDVEKNCPFNNKYNTIVNNKVNIKDLTAYFFDFDFDVIDSDLINEIMNIYNSYGYNEKLKIYSNLINKSEYSIKDLIYLSFAYIDNETEYAVSYGCELENVINLFLSNTNIQNIFDYNFDTIPY